MCFIIFLSKLNLIYHFVLNIFERVKNYSSDELCFNQATLDRVCKVNLNCDERPVFKSFLICYRICIPNGHGGHATHITCEVPHRFDQP